MSVLENIFYGKVKFIETLDFDKNKKYQDVANAIDEVEKMFYSNLTDSERETYEKLLSMHVELFAIENEAMYKASFAFGIRLMNEVYNLNLLNV